MTEIPEYQHGFVTALHKLLVEWSGGQMERFNPLWPIMWAFQKELPSLLKELDGKPEAVAELRAKLSAILASDDSNH